MQIDKKLCVCYAENNLSVKIKYLLMSLEKGVTVERLLRLFCLKGGRQEKQSITAG